MTCPHKVGLGECHWMGHNARPSGFYWLLTGDVFSICPGSGGENISSIEVENILHTHPSISEAAVRVSVAVPCLSSIVNSFFLLRSAPLLPNSSTPPSHLAVLIPPIFARFLRPESCPLILSPLPLHDSSRWWPSHTTSGARCPAPS